MQIITVAVVLDEDCNVRGCVNCDEEYVRKVVEMCRKRLEHGVAVS